MGEALRSPEGRERELVSRVAHPELGWLPNIRLPLRFSETPVADPVPAPLVGEHSREILIQTLGYSESEASALVASGAVYSRAMTKISPN